MKKLSLLMSIFICVSSFAQDVSKTLIGSSYNMYSVISGSTNPVHANNALGTISFTHRQNADLLGGSGVIQTSWSTDAGDTWQYVIQPTNDETQYNRYPSGAIVDPIGDGLSSAHTVVVGPTTSSAAQGWVSNYFYNFALDGSGGREFNKIETEGEKLIRVGMMVDKNDVVRVLGYLNTNLHVSTGEFNASGSSYYTDYVYASTSSYYTGEYLDADGNVTTPAAWGTPTGVNLGDTIFYMTSANPDLFSDGTVDITWSNELEIINYYDANGDSLLTPDTLNVWNNVASIQDANGDWIATTFAADSYYVELNGAIDSTLVEGVPGYYWTEQSIETTALPAESTNDDTFTIYGYSMGFSQDGDIGYAVMLGDYENGLISPYVHETSDGGLTWNELTLDFSIVDGFNRPFFSGELDCTVDVNGALHMMCIIEEGDAGTEALYNPKIYDVVVDMNTPSDPVSINYISDINTTAIAATDPQAVGGEIGWGHRVQASRSSDGSKVFALWNDVNIEEFDVEQIEYPDIYAIGIDVVTDLATGVKNFTKYTTLEGDNFWTFTSPVTFDIDNTYHLPTTTSENGASGLDPTDHYYVHGIQFNEEEFIEDFTTFSLEDLTANDIRAFPNPTSEFTNISITLENTQLISIRLVNTIGQELYSMTNEFDAGTSNTKINLSTFDAGIYFYTVSNDKFSSTRRLVIK
jgi:hypothetical protein